jgi:hypothetical protein
MSRIPILFLDMSNKVKFHIHHSEQGTIMYGPHGAILQRFKIFPMVLQKPKERPFSLLVSLAGAWLRGQPRCQATNGTCSSETGQSLDSNGHFQDQPEEIMDY